MHICAREECDGAFWVDVQGHVVISQRLVEPVLPLIDVAAPDQRIERLRRPRQGFIEVGQCRFILLLTVMKSGARNVGFDQVLGAARVLGNDGGATGGDLFDVA